MSFAEKRRPVRAYFAAIQNARHPPGVQFEAIQRLHRHPPGDQYRHACDIEGAHRATQRVGEDLGAQLRLLSVTKITCGGVQLPFGVITSA